LSYKENLGIKLNFFEIRLSRQPFFILLAAVKEQIAAAAAHRARLEADFQRMRLEIADRAATKEKEKQSKLDMREELKKRAEEDKQRRKNDRELVNINLYRVLFVVLFVCRVL